MERTYHLIFAIFENVSADTMMGGELPVLILVFLLPSGA